MEMKTNHDCKESGCTKSPHKATDASIRYVLHGAPIPLARPRLSRYPHSVFNPQEKEMKAAEWDLKFQAPDTPMEGPISMDVVFYMPIAKSMYKTRRTALMDKPHASRPDIDNLLKFLLDAAKCLYKDDSQVCKLTAVKIYSDNPRTEFTIREAPLPWPNKMKPNILQEDYIEKLINQEKDI